MTNSLSFAASPKVGTSGGPLDLARSRADLFAGNADRNEQTGRLADDTVAALRQDNMFGLLAPREVGGLEASPTEALAVYEEVSRADGATGWVLTTCSLATGLAGAFLDDEAVAAIFADGTPIIAGAGAPMGRAKVVDGGFMFSGRWSYGSGIHHATHLHNGGLIVDPDGTLRTDLGHHIFVAPLDTLKLDDNWDVLGLRGTGSVDYEIEPVFLPTGYAHPGAAPRQYRGGINYRIGMAGMVSLAHTGFFLGIGRQALDLLIALALAKKGRTGSLVDSEAFQEKFGVAEATYRSARAFVYESWRTIEAHIADGSPVDPVLLNVANISMCHLASASADVAEFVYRSAGGAALRQGPLQRAFRDCLAGRQHIRVSDDVLRTNARELLVSGAH